MGLIKKAWEFIWPVLVFCGFLSFILSLMKRVTGSCEETWGVESLYVFDANLFCPVVTRGPVSLIPKE